MWGAGVVCVLFYLLYTEYKTIHSNSKLGTFWLVPTTSKDCLRGKIFEVEVRVKFKLWLGSGG